MAASFGGFSRSSGFLLRGGRPEDRRSRAVSATGEQAAGQDGQWYHPGKVAKFCAPVVVPASIIALGGSGMAAVVYGTKAYMTDIAQKEDESHVKKLESLETDIQDIKTDVKVILAKMTCWENFGGICKPLEKPTIP